jgi:hypothetical protein
MRSVVNQVLCFPFKNKKFPIRKQNVRGCKVGGGRAKIYEKDLRFPILFRQNTQSHDKQNNNSPEM